MAGRTRFRGSPSRRGPRRRYLWQNRQNGTDLTSISAGGTSVVDLLENTDQAVRVGTVAVRMLLNLRVEVATPGTDCAFVHAVMVYPLEAFTAGAIVEPATDRLNYYLWDGHAFGTETGAPHGQDYRYDIRSKRSLRDLGRVLMHVIENTGGSTMLYQITSNVLLQLP